MPEPYIEIDSEEFLFHMACGDYGVQSTNYRQVYMDDDKAHLDVNFFNFPNKCIAVADRYFWRGKADNGKGIVVGKDKWGFHRLRFFRVGCHHPGLRELGQEEAKARGFDHYGMFDHIHLCPVCGYVLRYDSSG